MSTESTLKVLRSLTGSSGPFFNLILSINIGAGFWVSSLGGLILFKNLPRSTFGQVQQKLIPSYLTLTSTLSTMLLTIFKLKNVSSSSLITSTKRESLISISLISMTISSIINLFLLEPRTTFNMIERNRIEKKKLDKSNENPKENDSSKNDEDEIEKELRRANSNFKKFHGLSTSLNLFGFLIPGFLTSLLIGQNGL